VATSRHRAARLVETADPTWQRALTAVSHDVYHLPRYAALEGRRIGARPLAYLYQDGADLLFLPLLMRAVPGSNANDATSAYGYPGPVSTVPPGLGDGFWDAACAALPPTLARAGAVSCFVRLHPLLPFDPDALASTGTVAPRGPTVLVDLRRPVEQMWAQLRKNHRRQIEAAYRDGVTTRFDDSPALDEFIGCYHETMRRVNAADDYFFAPAYFQELWQSMGDGIHLVTAHRRGDMIGGGLFFEHAGIVQYHLGATRTAHLHRQPMKLLLHEVMRWAAARGDHVLHLGGGVGGRPDSLFHFKAGFSPWRTTFHTWQLVVVPDRYAALVADRAASGTADPAFFPAYRAP
jgi:hypothetical protein